MSVIHLPTDKEERSLVLSKGEALDRVDRSHFSKIFGENIVIYTDVKETGISLT